MSKASGVPADESAGVASISDRRRRLAMPGFPLIICPTTKKLSQKMVRQAHHERRRILPPFVLSLSKDGPSWMHCFEIVTKGNQFDMENPSQNILVILPAVLTPAIRLDGGI